MKQETRNALKKLVVPIFFVSIFFVSFGVFNVHDAHAGLLTLIKSPLETISSWLATNSLTAISSMLNGIGVAALTLAGWVLTASGFALDFSIDMFVDKMAANISQLGVVSAGWVAFRDLANMAFIFVLLFSAISTILRIDQFGVKRLLPKILVVALLLNFSFFFTGLFIDATNILASGFTKNITCTTTVGGAASTAQCGFATAIADALRIQTITSSTGNPDLSAPFLIFMFSILGAGFTVITAFLFLIIAVLLITRFVVLIFILILSPIAFVSMIIPGSGITKKWRDTLISQAVFAPFFFILISFVITVISSPAFKGALALSDTATFAASFQNVTVTGESMRIVLNFIIITVFEIAALVIAKNSASSGGAVVSKLTGFATKSVGALTLGTGAYVMRNTAGRVANSKYARAAASRVPLVSGYATAGMNKVANSSFDVRHGLGNEYGRPTAGGFVGQEKRKQEREMLVADAKKDRKYKDENVKKAAKEKRDAAMSEQLKLSPADQRTAEAAREQREKDIVTKEGELADALRDLTLAMKMQGDPLNNPAQQAHADGLVTAATTRRDTAIADKNTLIAGRDKVKQAEIEMQQAEGKTLSGRVYQARKQDTLANRFGGQKNPIGRIYTSLFSPNAAKNAKAIRAVEKTEVDKKNREAKTGLEAQKRPFTSDNSALEADVKMIDGVKKYGTGANMLTKQADLLAQYQTMKTDFDDAITHNDYLRSGQLQKDMKKLQDEELKPINDYLAQFGATADLNTELANRMTRIQSNNTTIKDIDKKIAAVGATDENIRDLFEQYRNTGGTP